MRKFYYLKPNIQYAFTGAFTLLSAIEIGIFTILLYVVESLNIHRSYDVMLYIRFSIIFLMVLVISGFNFWFGMRLSHRIVGPMIQIQRVLERALKGKYDSRINLRTNDYLHEIAEDINLLLEKLDQKSPKTDEKKSLEQQDQSDNNENNL
ncbi:MAG: methyl-accepting chemotaxis protein [bacterium]|nr:MAG: methyl-accepting chemotaxis protein [bacterium]